MSGILSFLVAFCTVRMMQHFIEREFRLFVEKVVILVCATGIAILSRDF